MNSKKKRAEHPPARRVECSTAATSGRVGARGESYRAPATQWLGKGEEWRCGVRGRVGGGGYDDGGGVRRRKRSESGACLARFRGFRVASPLACLFLPASRLGSPRPLLLFCFCPPRLYPRARARAAGGSSDGSAPFRRTKQAETRKKAGERRGKRSPGTTTPLGWTGRRVPSRSWVTLTTRNSQPKPLRVDSRTTC
ncbi:hypothetical protein PVAP13_1NG071501 [Panicum virgatum]|uniref:Uncharacterized protein n=1 Tax=Panicum virgatum TaxID=38727 RepID=A0A8T0WP48_PANVG|nr:hypothetical protein PVAP13_1NG071501 [Panicum virgatum]